MLLRHGQTVLNQLGVRHRRENTPLTKQGLDEAWFTSLPPLQDPLVFSSPLLRAYGTACLIAGVRGWGAPVVDERLTERLPDQSCEDAAAPVAEWLRELRGDVLVVTHAGIIKGLTNTYKSPGNCVPVVWEP